MIAVTMEGDFSGTLRAMQAGSGVSFRRIHEAIGEYGVSDTVGRFRRETDPRGQRWKRSQRVVRDGGKTLTDKGILRRSHSYRATDVRVDYGTNDKRARLLYNGGKFGRGHKNTMPPRQAMGLNSRNTRDILDMVGEMTGTVILRGKVVRR